MAVHAFTDENVIRCSEQSIRSLKILHFGKAVILKFVQGKVSKSEIPFSNVEKLCFHDGYFHDIILPEKYCPLARAENFGIRSNNCIEPKMHRTTFSNIKTFDAVQ